MNLIKPQKLDKGDEIATVSLSSGCAGNKDDRGIKTVSRIG